MIEQTASGPAGGESQSGGQPASGAQPADRVDQRRRARQELPTALGTVLRVKSGGVEYTLLGSVPQAAAEMAAGRGAL